MAAAEFPLDQTFLLSIWLETVLYGFLVALFVQSLFVLLRWRSTKDSALNAPMLGAVILMFTLATTHISLNFYRLVQGYVLQRNRPGGPVAYFANLADTVHITKDTIYVTQSLIGDALSIYRCFIVWNRSWLIVALPLVMLVVNIISGYRTISLFAQVTPDTSVFDGSVFAWITTFYSVALAQNIMTTSLIAYMIWKTHRKTAAFGPASSSLLPVVRILVESAVFYSLAELILIILYGLNHNAQYVLLETITPVVGITFTSIIIRVDMRSSRRDPMTSVGASSTTVGGAFPSTTSKAFQQQPMTINVTRDVLDDLEHHGNYYGTTRSNQSSIRRH